MVNQQTLQGNWNEIKGKIRNKWGQLTNDDLQQASGNADQLVGVIQRKTGEARDSIEQFLDELTSNGASGIGQAAETAREYAQHAMEAMQERSKQAADTFRRGYDQASETVRNSYGQAEDLIKEPRPSRRRSASVWACSSA